MPFEEISIFSNSSHLGCSTGLSDIILKGNHPRTIPTKFDLILFSGFRREDLNVIFYQNMPNLHNRYKSTERKISQKNPEYMLNYSLPCGCSNGQLKFHPAFFIFSLVAILVGSLDHRTQFWKGAMVAIGPVVSEKIKL